MTQRRPSQSLGGMFPPALNTIVTRRRFPPVAIAGIVLLAAFAGWAAWTMTSAAQDVRRSTLLSDGFQRARYAVAEEALAVRAYEISPDPRLRDNVDEARTGMAHALAITQTEGTPQDRALAHRVLQTDTLVLTTIDRLIDAANAGDFDRVSDIDRHTLQPMLTSQQQLLDQAAASHRAQALASVHSSQRSERVMVIVTIVAFALGVLLVVSIGKVLRVRAELEEARDAEVERLRMAAFTDTLTGLPNHRAFHEQLQDALSTVRVSEPVSLV